MSGILSVNWYITAFKDDIEAVFGALYDKENQIIVVAPDIGTDEVYPDDFSSPVEVVQNTVSGLFHEMERDKNQMKKFEEV